MKIPVRVYRDVLIENISQGIKLRCDVDKNVKLLNGLVANAVPEMNPKRYPQMQKVFRRIFRAIEKYDKYMRQTSTQ